MRVNLPLLGLAVSLNAVVLTAQTGEPRPRQVLYAPKPLKPASYLAPMKPLIRLADLKAKHQGQATWSELVVDDKNNRADVISAAPGSKVARHLHADAPEYWVVQQGRIRFEIEDSPGKFQIIDADRGSLVFAAERHLHSIEVIGSEPAIRFQVALADTTPVFEAKPAGAEKGMEYMPVTLSTGINPDDVPNPAGKPDRLLFNAAQMWKEHAGRRSWSDLAIRKNRAHANIICGYAADAKRNPGDRGHYHADFAEIWIVLQGRQRWTIEGLDPFVAGEGDIVYAPATRWHLPEADGEGPSCRLAITPYPAGNHLYDPAR
jgi:mannose-6-phosphate isomerase-like protein (cupin superfamily)